MQSERAFSPLAYDSPSGSRTGLADGLVLMPGPAAGSVCIAYGGQMLSTVPAPAVSEPLSPLSHDQTCTHCSVKTSAWAATFRLCPPIAPFHSQLASSQKQGVITPPFVWTVWRGYPRGDQAAPARGGAARPRPLVRAVGGPGPGALLRRRQLPALQGHVRVVEARRLYAAPSQGSTFQLLKAMLLRDACVCNTKSLAVTDHPSRPHARLVAPHNALGSRLPSMPPPTAPSLGASARYNAFG
jgi:hypothetical protein